METFPYFSFACAPPLPQIENGFQLSRLNEFKRDRDRFINKKVFLFFFEKKRACKESRFLFAHRRKALYLHIYVDFYI